MSKGFGSKLGIVAATAGSAVGLGNLWGFPYKAGTSGGGFFVLIYLLFVVGLGMPLMLSEFMIGKNGRSDAITSFDNLTKKKTLFNFGGVFGLLASYLILTFYGVLAGWAIVYFIKGITVGFGAYNAMASGDLFGSMIMNKSVSITGQVVFMVAVIAVLLRGVESGIEKMSKILMPLLFLIIIGMALYGLTQSGAKEAYTFLFTPSFEGVELSSFQIATSALGQAFFSLSLGMAVIITYGSYVDKDLDIISITRQVVVADTSVAILAGLAIFPIVFSAGLDPSSGPGLMFISLPIGFSTMPAGRIIGTLFFLLVVVAALTSAVSLLENTVSLLGSKFKIGRTKATITAGVIATIVGFGSQYALEFGVPFLNWTGQTSLLDQLDQLTMNFLIPASALVVTLFVGYRLDIKYVESEFKSQKNAKYFVSYMKTVAPALVGILLIHSMYTMFNG